MFGGLPSFEGAEEAESLEAEAVGPGMVLEAVVATALVVPSWISVQAVPPSMARHIHRWV